MPKVSQQHREQRRDQIVDAALRSFAAKGFHRTSMADVIAESRLSAGAIYGYFESKQELALAVARRVLGNRMSEFGDRLAQADELPAPSAMLGAMMTGLARDMRDPGVLVQLWGEAVTDPELSRLISPVFAEVQDVMGPYLERWARERLGMGADAAAWSRQMVPVFLGLGQGYIIQSALLPGFDGPGYLAGVGALLDG
ncbi:MAG TPA: TetR/AcrR family transcriptional regulator [Pseudolysinimonas sp.]|jgi:AcrR family transcriptional regulator|nr:TetR/AcrR family transcriptional regulator [Pseudolysinimonas sp.]